jgi:PAS domain-containing protein
MNEKDPHLEESAVKLTPDVSRLDPIASTPGAALVISGDRLTPYGLVVALVVSVMLFGEWLEAHFVGAPVSLLLCAVMFSGWLGGLGPGLVAAGLALLVFDYAFVAPLNSFAISAVEIPRVFAFGISAFLIGLLSGEQRRNAESLRCARDELADTYRELKMTNEALRQENTMRGQAEAALRDSEQRFRDFAETGSDWLWETGPDHRITYIAAISLYAAIPEGLDKKTMGAAGIKHAGRTYGADQLVGGLCEEFEPVSAAFIRKWSAMRGVILRAVQLGRAGIDRDEFAKVFIHVTARNGFPTPRLSMVLA